MTTAVATVDPGYTPALFEPNHEQLELMKKQFGQNLSDVDFAFCVELVRRTGLNPFAHQIHFVTRRTREKKPDGSWVDTYKVTPQVGIDGYRLIAQRTLEYVGQDGPYWCGDDGIWLDAWLADEPPRAAKVGVMRAGHHAYTYAVALWKEYAQLAPVYEGQGRDRKLVGQKLGEMWEKMPANQLAKCAEAAALRKVFPQDLSGLFVDAEEGANEHVLVAQAERTIPPAGQLQRPVTTGEIDGWIVSLRQWLEERNLRMGILAECLGIETVTPRTLREWAASLKANSDPLRLAKARVTKRFPTAVAEAEASTEPAPATAAPEQDPDNEDTSWVPTEGGEAANVVTGEVVEDPGDIPFE